MKDRSSTVKFAVFIVVMLLIALLALLQQRLPDCTPELEGHVKLKAANRWSRDIMVCRRGSWQPLVLKEAP